jgi:hypothetical protein
VSKAAKTSFIANYDVDGDPGIVAVMYAQFNAALADLPCGAYEAKGSDDSLRPIERFLGQEWKVIRHYQAKRQETILAERKGLICLLDYYGGDLRAFVAGKHIGVARSAAQSIVMQVPDRKEPDPDVVRIAIWQLGPSGVPNYSWKTIKVPQWGEVSKNYPGEINGRLARYVKMYEPEDEGKIILWHGPPGTGKTSAIRMLMREWKGWCSFHYVSDPEKLFENPAYLLAVGASDDAEAFRMIIAEDTDAFLKVDSMSSMGGAMSRLLNFSDGILGQGSNTIFLLTTNAAIETLNPAITRPGRCLGHDKFLPFSRAQIAEWMPAGVSAPNKEEMTLAELIQHVKAHE